MQALSKDSMLSYYLFGFDSLKAMSQFCGIHKASLGALYDTCHATSHMSFRGRYVTRARSHKVSASSLLNELIFNFLINF
ncbi:hypothetical protein Hanom_Chr08g00687911 [Helianthus anomalus]